jgi:hypothetical protein
VALRGLNVIHHQRCTVKVLDKVFSDLVSVPEVLVSENDTQFDISFGRLPVIDLALSYYFVSPKLSWWICFSTSCRSLNRTTKL